MNSKHGESGAQLLARLGTRPDLCGIDPQVFCGSSPTKMSTGNKNSANTVSMVELCGVEGVGKSELALYYTSRACLPALWKDVPIGGPEARVIFVDTEFKFSILRLAVILEKQILSIFRKHEDICQKCDSANCNEECSNSSGRGEKGMESLHAVKGENTQNKDMVTSREIIEHTSIEALGNKVKIAASDNNMSSRESLQSDRTSETLTLCAESHALKKTETDGSHSNLMMSSKCVCEESSTTQRDFPVSFSPENMEELVQDCLSRVSVLRVLNSQQLLASLLSLETLLTKDSKIALVVIDSISAFFWSDRLADPENNQCIEKKIAPMAQVVSRYAGIFGVNFVITKSALIGSENASGTSGKFPRLGEYSRCAKESVKEDKVVTEHVEFMGKSWANLPLKRITLTKNINSHGVKQFKAWSNEWDFSRTFTIKDDELQFQP